MAFRQTATALEAVAWRMQQVRGAKATTTKLPVALLKDVDFLGAAGETVKVSPGHARNFLLPNRLGRLIPAPTAGRRVKGARHAAADRLTAPAASARPSFAATATPATGAEVSMTPEERSDAAMDRLISSVITLRRKTEDGTRLASPAGREDVVDAVARQLRLDVDPRLLDIGEDSLTEVGQFMLPLKVVDASGKRAELEVHVSAT